MLDVITIGAATQDIFLESEGFHLMYSPKVKRLCECFPLGEKINVERIYFETGGGATNAAASFKNLGFRVGVVVRVGTDVAGSCICEDLKRRRIPLPWVREVKGGTSGYAVILLTPHGDRTALVHRGVSATFSAADIPWENLRSQWLFVTSLGGNLRLLKRLFATACARGIQVAFNPGMEELKFGLQEVQAHCSAAHVLILNRDEAAQLVTLKFRSSRQGNHPSRPLLVKEGMGRIPYIAQEEQDIRRLHRFLRTRFKNAMVVTDGERGAYYWDSRKFLFAQARRVKIVNSTGAGDAFGSGFISGILRWHDPVRALQLGTLNAAGTIQQMGAKSGLLTRCPTSRELERVKVVRV